jgi:GNAT superfamily N-acetyltransferase
MDAKQVDVMVADASHEVYVDKILDTIREAAKVRGTGIAERTHEYVTTKMKEGKAIIALCGDDFAGFTYIESWGNKQYVATSGLIVHPNYRGIGLAKRIKAASFRLARLRWPKAKIFSLTSGAAVMKMNTELGYVPVTSSISGYRPTVRHTFGGWSSHSSNDSVGFDKIQQDISGHYFFPREGAYVQLKGQSKYASRLDTCEVSTFYFLNKGFAAVRSKVNNAAEGELHEEVGTGGVQAVSVRGRIGQVRWSVEHADSATFYGVAMDGKQGISLDNFSVRGSSGLHLRSIPLHTLRDFQRLRPYDLIVVQYGLNVATERGVKYDGYKKGMLTVIEHLKTAFPETSILLVSVGDREYKNENGDLRTMPGVKNLIRYQQSIAADSHIAFWNMYEAMGGQGSIVDMIGQKMANLDYTHINFKGGRHLAGILFETLMYGKEQYEKRKAYEEE